MPRKPDLPCSSCGTLMWRGRGSLPPGKAKCQPCRRGTFAHGTRWAYRDDGCRCLECRRWNRDYHKRYRQERRDAGRPVRTGGGNFWISPALRREVYERDGWVCQLCNEPTDPDADPSRDDWAPSLDHIVPRSKGGGHELSNLRTTHRWCNSIRGAGDYHSELFEEAA